MHAFLLLCGAFLLLRITTFFWRLYLHPLSGFPGPKLAAATSCYRTYYEVIQGGKFLRKLHTLHAVYGAVVRIGPNELHFNEPGAYDDIYSFKRCYRKEPSFYKCFGVDRSTFGIIDPHEARKRRSVIGPLFAQRSALEAENLIQEHVSTLIEKLESCNKPSDLFLGFRCAALDIITSFSFGKSVGALESEKFAHPLVLAIQEAVPLLFFIKSLPWLPRILSLFPSFICTRLHRHAGSQLAVRQQVEDLIKLSGKTSIALEGHIPTVHHQLLSEKQVPMPWAANQCLLDEALSLLQAGSDTVGNTCTLGTFHVLQNPAIHQKLVQELVAASPDRSAPTSLTVLQTLPYLTAIVKESLRLSYGFVSPLPRIVDKTGQHINGLHVPCGTIVGMSVTALHNNSELFPHPKVFNPERWLRPDSKYLERFLVPFSKGPRMCLGTNLAWAELYIMLGSVFGRLDLELHDTHSDEFEEFKDYFIPVHQGRHLHVKTRKNGRTSATPIKPF